MNRIFKKCFGVNAWTVGYRNIPQVDDLMETPKQYSYIKTREWIYTADPFLFSWEGDMYLFVEWMNRFRGIGEIAVSKYKRNGKWGAFHKVLTEEFHLSYPNVFCVGEDVYMIPETGSVQEIRLYKCVTFPQKWELEKVLLKGGKYVDTSILIQDDSIFIFAFNQDAGCSQLFIMDKQTKTLEAVPEARLMNERPGGNVFWRNDKYVRPIQNGERYYGESLFWVEGNFNTEERIIGEFTVKDILKKPKRITGMHTFNRCGCLEVIDIKYERYICSKPFCKMWHKLKKMRG